MIDFSATGINVSPFSFAGADTTSSKTSEKEQIDAENTDKNGDENRPEEMKGRQNPEELSQEEIRELSKLKQRDREVRAHEQAHIAAGGQYVRGSAHFEYQKGPDGKSYAVGGEVSIDTSKVSGDPEATARKMQTIRSAAMAPASPSGQDRRVAAKATQIENQMRTEILLKRYEESASFEKGKTEAEPSNLYKGPDQAQASRAGISIVV